MSDKEIDYFKIAQIINREKEIWFGKYRYHRSVNCKACQSNLSKIETRDILRILELIRAEQMNKIVKRLIKEKKGKSDE